MKRKGFALVLAVLLSLSVISSCKGGPESLESVRNSTGDLLHSGQLKEVTAAGNEWVFLGLTLSGRTSEKEKKAYLESVGTYVQGKGKNRLNDNKSTENSRVILGIVAAGGDPENIGSQNLVEGLKDIGYVRQQGNNGPIWALIAVDAAGLSRDDPFREELIKSIVEVQQDNGGYSMMNGEPDTDLTAMAIQALSPYEAREDVRQCIDRAVRHLSERQKEDGTFEGYGFRTSESVSQVILALTSLGIRPETDERFIKNGITLVDALTSFRKDKGFRHLLKDEKVNDIATEQAYLALIALKQAEEGGAFRYFK